MMKKFRNYLLIIIVIMLQFNYSTSAQYQIIIEPDSFNIKSQPQSEDKYVEMNYSGIGLVDLGYVNTAIINTYYGSFSWFCWVSTVSDYPYGYILSDFNTDYYNNVRLQMNSRGQLKLMVKLNGRSTENVLSPEEFSINDGKDHFIGFTIYRESDNILEYAAIWIDGQIVASINIESHTEPLGNIKPFWIGTKNDVQLYTFKGIIDNVLIYDRNLHKTEIEYLYGGGTMKSCGNPDGIRMDDLVGWFEFSEGFAGRTVNNMTGVSGIFTGGMVYWVDHRDREHIYY